MTCLVRPARRLAAGGVALVALTAFTGAWGTANAGSPPSAAARLVAQMRAATGRPTSPAWSPSPGAPRAVGEEQATVDVRSAGGALEVSSGGTVIVDEGDHMFFKDELGWTGRWPSPARATAPRPTPPGRCHCAAAPSSTGPSPWWWRRGADGTPAQRLTIDDATRLLLAREVLAADGNVRRSFRFEELDLADGARPG